MLSCIIQHNAIKENKIKQMSVVLQEPFNAGEIKCEAAPLQCYRWTLGRKFETLSQTRMTYSSKISEITIKWLKSTAEN